MTLEGRKFRNELKYYLNIRDYFVHRQKVAALLTLDKNSLNEEGYNIRSLYFDGRHDHALYDKIMAFLVERNTVFVFITVVMRK